MTVEVSPEQMTTSTNTPARQLSSASAPASTFATTTVTSTTPLLKGPSSNSTSNATNASSASSWRRRSSSDNRKSRSSSSNSTKKKTTADEEDFNSDTWMSLLGLLEAYEFFIPVDQTTLWRRHIAWANPKGKDIKDYTTNRFASNMVFLSLILGSEMNMLFNSAKFTTDIRQAMMHEEYGELKYWTGMLVAFSACVTVIGMVTTFTAWGLIGAISDVNSHCLLRSSMGQYVTSLPSRFVVAALYLFLVIIVLFIIELVSGPGMFILLTVVGFLFFQVIVSLSAFGRLIIHTGAMGKRPVLDPELERYLLPSGLHASLLIKATERSRRRTSVVSQYRRASTSNNNGSSRKSSTFSHATSTRNSRGGSGDSSIRQRRRSPRSTRTGSSSTSSTRTSAATTSSARTLRTSSNGTRTSSTNVNAQANVNTDSTSCTEGSQSNLSTTDSIELVVETPLTKASTSSTSTPSTGSMSTTPSPRQGSLRVSTEEEKAIQRANRALSPVRPKSSSGSSNDKTNGSNNPTKKKKNMVWDSNSTTRRGSFPPRITSNGRAQRNPHQPQSRSPHPPRHNPKHRRDLSSDSNLSCDELARDIHFPRPSVLNSTDCSRDLRQIVEMALASHPEEEYETTNEVQALHHQQQRHRVSFSDIHEESHENDEDSPTGSQDSPYDDNEDHEEEEEDGESPTTSIRKMVQRQSIMVYGRGRRGSRQQQRNSLITEIQEEWVAEEDVRHMYDVEPPVVVFGDDDDDGDDDCHGEDEEQDGDDGIGLDDNDLTDDEDDYYQGNYNNDDNQGGDIDLSNSNNSHNRHHRSTYNNSGSGNRYRRDSNHSNASSIDFSYMSDNSNNLNDSFVAMPRVSILNRTKRLQSLRNLVAFDFFGNNNGNNNDNSASNSANHNRTASMDGILEVMMEDDEENARQQRSSVLYQHEHDLKEHKEDDLSSPLAFVDSSKRTGRPKGQMTNLPLGQDTDAADVAMNPSEQQYLLSRSPQHSRGNQKNNSKNLYYSTPDEP